MSATTVMNKAFNERKVGGSPQRENKPPTPAPASPKKGSKKGSGDDNVLAQALLAVTDMINAKDRQKTAKATETSTAETKAQWEEKVKQVAKLHWGASTAKFNLAEWQKVRNHHTKGTPGYNEAEGEIDQLENQLEKITAALNSIEESNPSAHLEGTKLYTTDQEALKMSATNREILGSAKPADIGSRIDGGVAAGFMTRLTADQAAEYKAEGWPTVTFKREVYGSTKPEDESISDVTASVAELLDDLQQRNSDRDAVTIAELRRGEFYISDQHEPDGKDGQLPSELDLLREEPGFVRSASEFLTLEPANSGQRYVVRTGRGFTVLENRDDRPIAVKTSDPQTGHALFTTPDRNSGGRMARPSAPDIANGKAVSLTDLSAIWYPTLRLALEGDLRRETESADRRETADELRDLSDVPDLITAYALQQGQAGTVVVDVKKLGEREIPRLTMRLTGDGKGNFVVSRYVPGTVAKVDPDNRWLARAFDKDGNPVPMSVDILKRSQDWRDLVTANGWTDRNWQLARKANELDAVMITADNVGDLTGAEGKDGTYAFGVNDRRDDWNNPRRRPTDPIKTWFIPLGFIVKREGQNITPVWGVPGPSANKLEKLGTDGQSINALTPMFKFILRALLFAVAPRDEKGQRARVEVPDHLKSATTHTNAGK